MKNEVKLNIHMFFPEMQNDEISSEKHAALEKLLNLSPVDAEDSVEKFIAELESRFELIKPILGDQTEEFLGYCQNDITKLSDFFGGKFVRFGMDAVAVQKILRNIWQQTPCEDKRLNYNLYKYVDEKFYAIVNERKRNISFDHIPAPTDSQWETLKNDWESRRAHYAACLDIDIDYLDSEAVDGTIFPSASGLFANPVFGGATKLEFLNFWMPHLIIRNKEHNELSLVPSYIIDAGVREYMFSCNSCFFNQYLDFFQELTKVKMPNAGVEGEYFDEKFYLTDYEIFESAISKHYKDSFDDFSSQEITSDNVSQVLQETEKKWFDKVKGFFGKIQPSCFFSVLRYPFRMPGEEITYKVLSLRKNGEYIKNPDNLQLPEFINSCHEYVLVNKQISKSKHLIFYTGQKIYIPDNFSCFDKWIEHAEAFNAAHITVPNCYNVQKIDEYYKTVFPLMVDYRYGGEAYNLAKDELLKHPNIFHFRLMQFIHCITKLFDHYAQDENLSGIYKIQMLVTIKNNFADVYKICPDLNHHMTEIIEKLRESESSDLKIDNFADNINNIYYLCEKEKLKLQVKEAETKAEEQKKIFSDINHDIKSTCASVISSLDLLQNQSFTDPQKKLWRSAYIGAALINAAATAISMSYRSNEDWISDFDSSDPADINFKDIIHNAFTIVVPNMFVREYSVYKNESEQYFPEKNMLNCAEQEWFAGSTFEDRQKWLNKYWGDFQLKFDASCSEFKIGSKHSTAMHLFILFKEIILNAIKAAAWVEKEKRLFYFNFSIVDKILHIDIKNSSLTGVVKKEGQGLLIFNNYKEMFSIQNDICRFDNGVFFQHFEIPYGNSK